MAQAAAELQGAPAGEDRVPALAAATDNVGLFFGEDIFIAIGSILLMVGVLQGFGIAAEPLQLALWAIPTAICAFADPRVRGCGGSTAGSRPIWNRTQRGTAHDRAAVRLCRRRGGVPRLRAALGERRAAIPKRWGNAAFYALLATSFWLGDRLGDLGNGVLVLGLVLVAGFRLMGRGAVGRPPRPRSAAPRQRRGATGCSCPRWSSPRSRWSGRWCSRQCRRWSIPSR